jgi:hypothetical protein
VNIADASYTLNFLFLGGPELRPPFLECGVDSTPDDDALSCDSHPPCN